MLFSLDAQPETAFTCALTSSLNLNRYAYSCALRGRRFQHCSPYLSYEEAPDTPHSRTWAISEARKITLTRSVISMARPAGEVLVGSVTYAEYFSVDSLLQVK